MRTVTTLVAAACVLLSAGASHAQSSAESAWAAQSAEQLHWYVERNVDGLAGRFHDRLVILHANGMQRTKDETLGGLRSGQPIYNSIDVQDASVRIAGSTAVLIGKAPVRLDGQRRAAHVRPALHRGVRLCGRDVAVIQWAVRRRPAAYVIPWPITHPTWIRCRRCPPAVRWSSAWRSGLRGKSHLPSADSSGSLPRGSRWARSRTECDSGTECVDVRGPPPTRRSRGLMAALARSFA